MEELFSADDLWKRAREFAVVERERKLDPAKLVQATVLALCGPQGMQTTASVLYESLGGVGVARSTFDDWYDPEFSLLLKDLATRAVAAVKAVEGAHPDERRQDELLERIGDVRIVYSSSQRKGLTDHLIAALPPSSTPPRWQDKNDAAPIGARPSGRSWWARGARVV